MKAQTKSQRGQFLRNLRKINHASDMMRFSHKATYDERFCDTKRFKKWKSVFKKWSKRR